MWGTYDCGTSVAMGHLGPWCIPGLGVSMVMGHLYPCGIYGRGASMAMGASMEASMAIDASITGLASMAWGESMYIEHL